MFSGDEARRLLSDAVSSPQTTIKSMTQILISMYEGSDRDTVIGAAREFIEDTKIRQALRDADTIMKFDSRNYKLPTQQPGALASRMRKTEK